jgi:uncharacterized protein with GYD domain
MATYIVLGKFTQQGIKTVKDSPSRYEAFKNAAKDVTFKSVHYTVGRYDLVAVVEGSDQAVTAALLKLGAAGNVTTETMRAWSVDEMKGIVGGL